MFDNIKKILKSNHIFNNIVLASKPRIIKMLPKSDMSIIWIDIWNAQSGSKSRTLINRRFNIRRFIITIWGINMNLSILQYKNCWKWGHFAGMCRIQEMKCVKCNSPHQTIHHHEFAWCCKANDKINPPRLETKKGKLCPYSFRCSNCKGKYQTNSTDCPFWKHHFNKEWYAKEYAKLQKIWKKLIYSFVNNNKIWFAKTSNFFHRTFGKTPYSSILSSKSKPTSISSLFRNHSSL